MFSSLKFSTLRARSQNKGQQDDNNNPRNEYDDNDGADADISCASSLRCQQPFTKCKFLEYKAQLLYFCIWNIQDEY